MSDTQEAPTIEFPCPYPIKVMGPHEDDFSELVIDIVRKHAPEVTEADISYRSSRNNRYLSVRIVIIAQGVDQLDALHRELKATGRVSMVL